MIKLTNAVKYAVLAVFDMLVYSGGEPVTLSEISKRQNIPIRFLEQIFYKLKKANVVKSRRGPGGGYLLNRKAEEISIGDIIRVIEGPVVFSNCFIKNERELKKCAVSDKCLTDFRWAELGKRIDDFFNSVTMQDLLMKREKIFSGRRIKKKQNQDITKGGVKWDM